MLGRMGLAGLIAAATAGIAWLVMPDVFLRLGPQPETKARPAMAVLATGAPPAAAAPTPALSASPRAAPDLPRFHIARVSGRGMLVAAGSAAPGAEVTLLEGGRELGRARADARGEWVILPGDPLPPGPKELVLVARSPGGDPLRARDTLLLVVPEPPMAGPVSRPSAAGATAMLLPPTSGGAAPRPLQASDAAAGRQRLGLDVVDYDDAGAMRFAGSAPPGATVRIYVGREHAGDAVADQAGRWTLSPATQPGFGRHMLRVDQLAAAGSVAARIELPFQRDRLQEATLPDGHLVVQPGANLWRIARQVYGRGTRYTVIYEANREQIRDPNRIYPGQTFSLPETPAEAESSLSR